MTWLARHHGMSATTVQKWRRRATTADAPIGPKRPRSTVLTPAEEAIVAFRRHRLLPLDDCLYALQPTIPRLTRSTLHRCLQRHGIARLPDAASKRGRFRACPSGYFRADVAEVHAAARRLHRFVAVDRTSKFVSAELHERAARRVAAEFLEALAAAVPHRVHTVLTDNGTQLVDTPPAAAWQSEFEAREEPRAGERPPAAPAPSTRRASAWGPGNARPSPLTPGTNGRAERMNRTINDATVRRCYGDTHTQLRADLRLWLDAYDYARRLETLRGLTSYEFVCRSWAEQPVRFTRDPTNDTVGPNISLAPRVCVLGSVSRRGAQEDRRSRPGAPGETS